MLFNSLEFIVFFIVVTALYFALPHRFRWFLLLISSCYFYMAFVPIYILILGFTILIDYFAGIFIERHDGKKKKFYLICSLVANIGVLAVFKYYNFINDNISILTKSLGFTNHLPYLKILLPIGLSFHTFQAMSYTIEVYRGKQKAEKNFGIYALYVMFYPQLVAGPIERPQNILHQFYEKHEFNYDRVRSGLQLMLWGFFKKVVIADNLAQISDRVFNNVHNFSGASLWVAVIAFSIQIFCDFSGYSDIAIGAARVMGFDLMTNFRRPYYAQTIQDFWGRWHISLSTWFKDYLYIPLGGSRVAIPRWCFNIFVVFLISGLWHGANWTFIVWGALHGFYQVFGKMTASFRHKMISVTRITKLPGLYAFINTTTTFLLVAFAWIFFRANNLHDAMYVIRNLFSNSYHESTIFSVAGMKNLMASLALSRITIITLILAIGFMELVHYYEEYKGNIQQLVCRQPIMLRWAIYYSIGLIIVFLGSYETHQFIYFQF